MLAARLCVYRPAGCRGKGVDEPLGVGDQGVPGGAQGVPTRHGPATAAGERLNGTDRGILADLARQAGPALSTLRLNAELEHRLDETALLAARLKASSQRIVVAAARERRRLERDIHDGAQQQLLGLRLQLGALDDVGDEAALHALASRVESARASLRQLARGMCPPLLAEDGLPVAIQTAAQGAGDNVTVRSVGLGDLRLSRQVETVAYFCCLEALQNCARHAPGAAVGVELCLDGGRLVVSVHDDGPGFDPAQRHDGTGLAGMAQRLAEVGGRLDIDSTPGGGTTLTGRLPAHVRAAV